jgi:hypothetical protein
MPLKKRAQYLILIFIYAAPITAYATIFGFSISADHQRWAEFGSAMAGIYAPIVAITALAVLLAQVRLQSQINIHQFNQAHIVQARAEVDFYATKLAEAMPTKLFDNTTIRQYLHQHFQRPELTDFNSVYARSLALELNLKAPHVFSMWSVIYPIFAGLKSNKDPSFSLTEMSSKQRLIALLSFETCVCIENFHRVRTEGRLHVKYSFSPQLENNTAP